MKNKLVFKTDIERQLYSWDKYDAIWNTEYSWNKYDLADAKVYAWDKFNVVNEPRHYWYRYEGTSASGAFTIVSAPTASAYPSKGVSGDYYYVYKGDTQYIWKVYDVDQGYSQITYNLYENVVKTNYYYDLYAFNDGVDTTPLKEQQAYLTGITQEEFDACEWETVQTTILGSGSDAYYWYTTQNICSELCDGAFCLYNIDGTIDVFDVSYEKASSASTFLGALSSYCYRVSPTGETYIKNITLTQPFWDLGYYGCDYVYNCSASYTASYLTYPGAPYVFSPDSTIAMGSKTVQNVKGYYIRMYDVYAIDSTQYSGVGYTGEVALEGMCLPSQVTLEEIQSDYIPNATLFDEDYMMNEDNVSDTSDLGKEWFLSGASAKGMYVLSRVEYTSNKGDAVLDDSGNQLTVTFNNIILDTENNTITADGEIVNIPNGNAGIVEYNSTEYYGIVTDSVSAPNVKDISHVYGYVYGYSESEYPEDGLDLYTFEDGTTKMAWYSLIAESSGESTPADFVEVVYSLNDAEYPENGAEGEYWYVSNSKDGYEMAYKNNYLGVEKSFSPYTYPQNASKGDYWYEYVGEETYWHAKDYIETVYQYNTPTLLLEDYFDEDKLNFYKYQGTTTTTDLILTDANLRNDISYNHIINPEADLTIGCVACAELSFTFDTTTIAEEDFIKNQFTYYVRQFADEDWRQIGIFNPEEVEVDKNLRKVTAYDNIIKFDVFIDDFIAGYDFPAILYVMLRDLCSYCGVSRGADELGMINEVYQFGDNFEAINITGRQLLQYIAEAGAAFIYAGEDGTLLTKRYHYNPKATLDNTKYVSYSFADYTVSPVTKLVVQTTAEDVGVSAGTGDNVYKIENNPLFYAESVNETQSAVTNIYDTLSSGVGNYTPGEIELLEDFGLNCGDCISVNGKLFYIMEKTITPSGTTFKCNGNQKREQQASSINSEIVALRGKTNQLVRDIEKTQSTITDTAAGLESQITQTADEINTRITNEVSGLESSITQTESSISSQIQQQGETITEIRQDLDGISLTYNSDKGTASITIGDVTVTDLVDGSYVSKSVAGINLTGYVTFTSLETSGQSVINGDNITTGTISADRINMTGAISWSDLSSSCRSTIASYAGADGADAVLPDYIQSTYIDAVTIISPTIIGAQFYAGSGTDGYISMSANGLNFISNVGGSLIGMGYYSNYYNYPYITFGQGITSYGTDRGMIKKYGNGMWIGDSDAITSTTPTGTGLFVDFVEGKVYKYVNGVATEI